MNNVLIIDRDRCDNLYGSGTNASLSALIHTITVLDMFAVVEPDGHVSFLKNRHTPDISLSADDWELYKAQYLFGGPDPSSAIKVGRRVRCIDNRKNRRP